MAEKRQGMYKFEGESEPNDIAILGGCENECSGGGTEEEAEERAFRKS